MYRTYKLAVIVYEKSADPGVNASMPIPIEADHLNICKPSDRSSVVYLSILRKLKKLVATVTVAELAEAAPFDDDNLGEESSRDRRDLLEKMTAAGREDEYGYANDSQNKFARAFAKHGLKTASSKLYNNLLADIEQRFQVLVFHPLICDGADNATVLAAVQTHVVEPLSAKCADKNATAVTIMNALYFLTERCHIRWDKP
jgi:hypothetical protein